MLLHFFFKLANFGNDDRRWRTSPCSNRLESALDLNLIIETFSIGILILFLFVRLNSSQSQLSWGVWSKWLCGHSYHTFTTQRKPTSRGLVQYNILHVINNDEIIAAISEAYSFLTFSLSFLPGPSDSDSAGYSYVATDSCKPSDDAMVLMLVRGFTRLDIFFHLH